ncbi:MAG TPA: GNAT family N-acetyltransferase [Thermoplasmata archaeon]|nr:GNAT family N-acetyltransferase [Thermoplasmata archaeon]
MEGTKVRRLEERDIDAAIALTNLENWGYTRADFRRLLALSPSGCFVAEGDGRVVGCLTTTSYDGLAFLGAVIVRPELRGKGVGQAMMVAAVEHLKAAGVRTVRLNAYLTAIPFYERLGFHREYEVVRWHGPAEMGRMRGVRPLRRDDLEAIARLDRPVFGADRSRLLDRLSDEFSSTFLVGEHRGRIRGYIVGNPSGDACEIGPWVVEPGFEPLAEDLFRGLLAAAGVSEIAFSGPTTNEALVEFVRARRLPEAFRALRMWWGTNDFAGDLRGVWGLAGMEKG